MNKNIAFDDGREMTVGTMYCIGQNYAKHAKEMGASVPDSPIIFLKPPSAYIPDGGQVTLPVISQNVHHEVELVVIIGKECRNVSRADALDYVAGYAVGIDITMRDIQKAAKDKGHPWAVAKGFASSAPISKAISAEKVQSNIFDLELSINGELKQKVSTSNMERPVEELIEYLSSIFILEKGDVIFTGTPEGVGQIHAGDKITASLKGYAELNVTVI